jgi:membrane protein
MRANEYWQILKETVNDWVEDRVPRMGAALAYYSAFSIAPLLLIAVSVAGMLWFGGEQKARDEVHRQLEQMVGDPNTAGYIVDIMSKAHDAGGGALGTAIGVVVLLLGASGVFVELLDSLNSIWKVKPKPGQGLRGFLRGRLLSFSVVLGSGFLLLASLVVSTAISGLEDYLKEHMPGMDWVWSIVNLVVSFVLVTLLFAMIYKILPDAEVSWRDVWVGAVSAAVLFTAGKYLIGLYLAKGAVASAYGAAGTMVVFLAWVYYSAQILLFGAELSHVYARHAGSRILPSGHAVAVTAAQ